MTNTAPYIQFKLSSGTSIDKTGAHIGSSVKFCCIFRILSSYQNASGRYHVVENARAIFRRSFIDEKEPTDEDLFRTAKRRLQKNPDVRLVLVKNVDATDADLVSEICKAIRNSYIINSKIGFHDANHSCGNLVYRCYP